MDGEEILALTADTTISVKVIDGVSHIMIHWGEDQYPSIVVNQAEGKITGIEISVLSSAGRASA